jgi:hypothetical protein
MIKVCICFASALVGVWWLGRLLALRGAPWHQWLLLTPPLALALKFLNQLLISPNQEHSVSLEMLFLCTWVAMISAGIRERHL